MQQAKASHACSKTSRQHKWSFANMQQPMLRADRAGGATAAPLVDAAAALFQASAGAGAGRAAPAWQAHPLSRLLLAQPAAAAPLLEAVTGLLAGAPRRPGLGSERAGDAAAGLHAVAPFLSFALLEPDPAGAAPLSAHLSRCCAHGGRAATPWHAAWPHACLAEGDMACNTASLGDEVQLLQ